MTNANSAASVQQCERAPAADPRPGALAHNPAVDGLRGLAIVLVVLLHFGVAADFPNRSHIEVTRWLERIFYIGWSGVDLFFVLSGYLITTILLGSRDESLYLKRFYIRRALRILPLYYVALILALFVAPAATPDLFRMLEQPTDGQVWLWTYTLNIGMVVGAVSGLGLLGHFWTLAIEEQYYLFWPFVVKWASSRTLAVLCSGVIVGALALRCGWIWLGYSWEGAYRFTLTRFDALAVGGLIAVISAQPNGRRKLMAVAPVVLVISSVALILVFASVRQFYPSEPIVVTLGHTLLAAVSAALVVLAIRPSAPRWMLHRPLRILGKYSYSIYVWHWPLQRVLITWYPPYEGSGRWGGAWSATVFLLIGLSGSFVLGWCSYRIIEQPFLRLKRHFE